MSLRVQQGDATREALLKAARAEFGEAGYASTSVGSIAERAGVTKGAFYHHFDSKQQVFDAVFRSVSREIGREAFVVHLDREKVVRGRPAVRDLAGEDDETVWGHVVDGCRTYLQLHLDPGTQRILLVDGRVVLPVSRWNELRGEHSVELLRADLRRAMHRGLIPQLPLPMLAMMLSGALDAACLQIAGRDSPQSAVEEAMEVVRRLLDGLRGGRAREVASET